MTLNEMNISALTYPELDELKERVEQRMTALREEGVAVLRERMTEEAAALGVTLEELVGSARR